MASYAALRQACASMRDAQPERKWGNVDTWLVRRKMFAIFIVDDRGRTIDLWFKADPDRFLELTDRPAFRPAPSPRAPAKSGARPAPLIARTTPRLLASGD
jgi:predicted DNA-binding protein (MmcQ/YjbR family)